MKRDDVRVLLLAKTPAHYTHFSRLRELLEPFVSVDIINLDDQRDSYLEMLSYGPGPYGPVWRIIERGLTARVGTVLGFATGFLPAPLLRRWIFSTLGSRGSLLMKFSSQGLRRGKLGEAFETLMSLWQTDKTFGISKENTVVILPEENILSAGIAQGMFLQSIGAKVVVFNYTIGTEHEWADYFALQTPDPRAQRDRSFSKLFKGQTIWLPHQVELEVSSTGGKGIQISS